VHTEAIPAPPLREVRGPRAVGAPLRAFWDLVFLLGWGEFKHNYEESRLGYLWALLTPLVLFATIYTIVVGVAQRFTGEVQYYGLGFLVSMSLYTFFARGVRGAMRSLLARGALLRKASVPASVLPLSRVLSTGFTLIAYLVILAIWIPVAGVEPTWSWLLFPVLLAWLVVITCGAAILFAGLYVLWRDITHIWPSIARAIFFTGPVIFPIEIIKQPGILWSALSFNPLAPVLVQSRHWLIGSGAPSWFGARGYGFDGLMPFGITIAIWIVGVLVFSRAVPLAAEET
jgi:ABC-2 type transport system permease protein